jgi:hypothetical protein
MLPQLLYPNAMNIAHNEVKEAHALRAVLLGEVNFFVNRWQGIHKHIVFLEVYPQLGPHLSVIRRHLSGTPSAYFFAN